LYICTDARMHVRTQVCLPGASRTGCATHFAHETFFATMRSVPRGEGGSRGNKGPLQWCNAKRYAHRAAKCIMLLPGRRLQRASIQRCESEGWHTACSIEHALSSLSFFLSFSFSLASFITSAHTSKVNYCRAWTYEIIYRVSDNFLRSQSVKVDWLKLKRSSTVLRYSQ